MAEERPGLSDHRQQGRQLLKSQRESQEVAAGCRETQTGWETRIKRELRVSERHQPQGGQKLRQFTESSFQFGLRVHTGNSNLKQWTAIADLCSLLLR